MAVRLHDDVCRALQNGWGVGWTDACDCRSGKYEERQAVVAAGRPGMVVAIFRAQRPGVGVRFVVEDQSGSHAVVRAEQLRPST